MEDCDRALIPRVKLGTQGLEVSKLGFGCMSLSGVYNSPVEDENGISIILHAFKRGVTFFDTSDAYGPHINEVLLGKALRCLPRERVQLATKFGVAGASPSGLLVNGSPEYVRACCRASLERLGVDYIDLYYQHRIDKSLPIEDTIGELKKLVDEGMVKFIGLSEASPDTIRRAHAVHPICAVQMEWSLWSRDIEEEIVSLCRELGIGIVSYSPLGRGFFGGKAIVESIPSNSFLVLHPRFFGDNLEKNKILYARLEKISMKYEFKPSQLALAWILHQGIDVVPIPGWIFGDIINSPMDPNTKFDKEQGTTNIKHLDDNINAIMVKLTEEDMKEISSAVSIDEVAGDRLYEHLVPHSWKFANTPTKESNVSA